MGRSVQDKCVQFCSVILLPCLLSEHTFPGYFNIIQPFPGYFNIFQPLPGYFNTFQPFPGYFNIFQEFQILSSHFTIHTWPTKHISKFYKIGGSWGNFIFITWSTFHIILASDTRWNVSSLRYRLNSCVWVKVEVVECLVLNGCLILCARRIRHD